jgi:hypothetical protein
MTIYGTRCSIGRINFFLSQSIEPGNILISAYFLEFQKDYFYELRKETEQRAKYARYL